MNRDIFERRLNDWLDEGADQAPERFVWQALEDVERTPQRRAWITALHERADQVAPPARVLGVAAALVLLLVGSYLVFGRGNVGQDEPTPRQYETRDLERIVVWEGTKPADWTLDSLQTSGVTEIPARTVTPQAFLALPEMQPVVAGRYTNFTGPDSAFMSWSVVFETAADAHAALPTFVNEMASPDGWGLGTGAPSELGDDGRVFTGQTRALLAGERTEPVPMRLYLWRRGNLLLALGGWFEYDADQLLQVATGMDARAR
jgi:hypothetical protein